MAETFIECKDIDLLAQAPDFMEDAYTHIRNAETNMVTFRDALTSASYQVKNAYYETYNSIYTNIDTERNDLYHLKDNTNNIVSAIRAGDQAGAYSIYAEQIAVAAAELETEAAFDDTGATVGEVSENKGETEVERTFWQKVGHFFEVVGATLVDVVLCAFQALCKLVEDIVDTIMTLVGALVTGFCSCVDYLCGTHWADATEKFFAGFVAHDFTGSLFGSIYENWHWLSDNTIISESARAVIVDSMEWVAIEALNFIVPGLGVVVAAGKGFGSTAESVLANGGNFIQAIVYGGFHGLLDAGLSYAMGNVSGSVHVGQHATYGKFASFFTNNIVGTNGIATKIFEYGLVGKVFGAKGVVANVLTKVVGVLPTKGFFKFLGGPVMQELAMALPLGILGTAANGMFGFKLDGGGLIDTEHPFRIDYTRGGNAPGADGDPVGGAAREETEDESTDEETSEETTFDETSEETTDEPTIEQQEPGTTPVIGGGGGGDNTYPEPEAVTPGNDGGGGGSDVQLEPDPVTEPTPEEVPEPTPEEVTEETTEEPTPEEVTEETTEEPTPEEVTEETSEETTEEDISKYPKVTIERTGPESVTVGDPVNENLGSYNGGGGGGYVNEPSYEDVPISNPVEPTPEIVEEPIYNWESATPTVENPDLESVSAEDEVRQVAAREMEVQAVETSGSATLTDVSPIENMSPAPESTASTYTAPGFDTSMLGMGGVAVTAGGLTTYGITKKSKEEENSRKQEELDEFSRETEEDKDKFDVI